MGLLVGFLAIVFALKVAEATGGLEFDSWGGVGGAALVCWLGGWTDGLLGMVFPSLESDPSLVHALLISLGVDVLVTCGLLLVAWAIVPGAHIKRIHGLVVAAILIVGLRYAATVFASGFGL